MSCFPGSKESPGPQWRWPGSGTKKSRGRLLHATLYRQLQHKWSDVVAEWLGQLHATLYCQADAAAAVTASAATVIASGAQAVPDGLGSNCGLRDCSQGRNGRASGTREEVASS